METLLRCFPASNFPSPPCCCSSSPSRACAPFSINPDFPIPDTAGQVQRKEDRIAEPQVRVVNVVPLCTPSSASVLTTSLLLSAVVAQKCPLEDGWNHDANQVVVGWNHDASRRHRRRRQGGPARRARSRTRPAAATSCRHRRRRHGAGAGGSPWICPNETGLGQTHPFEL
jgi:hypothetical protein